MKEEIIEGEVFYFKHLTCFGGTVSLEKSFGREGERGSASDLCPLFPSSLCPGAEETGFPLTIGPQKIPFSFLAHPACYLAFLASLDLELA